MAGALWPTAEPAIRIFSGSESASGRREDLQFRLPLLRVWLDALEEDSLELVPHSRRLGKDSEREFSNTGPPVPFTGDDYLLRQWLAHLASGVPSRGLSSKGVPKETLTLGPDCDPDQRNYTL